MNVLCETKQSKIIIMTNQEIEKILKDQTIILCDSGVDCFAGVFIWLAAQEIIVNGKKETIELYSWCDPIGKKKKNANSKMFVIKREFHTYTIVDLYYQANAIWNYLLDKYSED